MNFWAAERPPPTDFPFFFVLGSLSSGAALPFPTLTGVEDLLLSPCEGRGERQSGDGKLEQVGHCFFFLLCGGRWWLVVEFFFRWRALQKSKKKRAKEKEKKVIEV